MALANGRASPVPGTTDSRWHPLLYLRGQRDSMAISIQLASACPCQAGIMLQPCHPARITSTARSLLLTNVGEDPLGERPWRPIPGSVLVGRCLYGLPQSDRATTPPPAGQLITAPVFLTPSSPAPAIHNIIKPSLIHEALAWWSVCL
ncbi:unnamed protein product [Pleuronectes platessa]|uniref:Uncharacterized protein n=1 Tax=Pleuronectes platessa TaxID=8262 RepID=A0A9N7V919_PLEPL|nr:unnamed protein product [Pleuronectes platessa]